MNQPHHLDDQILLAVNNLARRTPTLHAPVVAYAKYGVILFGALLLAGLVTSRHRTSRDLAATGWAAIAVLAALALNQPLGHLFAEQRPYVTHPALLRLADVTTDFSFPSDHAVMAGAVAVGLLLAHRRLGTVAAVAALLMAFARVYTAAHYPWDVLGGLFIGGLVAALGWVVLRIPLTRLTGRLRTIPGLRRVFAAPQAEVGTEGLANGHRARPRPSAL